MGSMGGSYVDKIVVHGKYDGKRNDYDIAVMKLSSPITVSGKSALPGIGYIVRSAS